MAFNRAQQPITQSVNKLAISCCKVSIDAASMGVFNQIEFNIDGETREIKAGYPLRTVDQVNDSLFATATVALQELGGSFKTLLTGIINSLNTSVVPTHSLLLEVFRPLAENVTIGMINAALLQEFTLNFNNDFNAVDLKFEQLVPEGSELTDVVTFDTLGQLTYKADSPMLDTGDLAIGLPQIKVSGNTLGAIQSAILTLTTEYRRTEVGYPRTLLKLTPLSHTVTLEVEVEEVDETSLNESFAIGSSVPVTFTAALYDGTAIVITIPAARLVPAGGPNISQTDFATITKKFIATGNTLLTIA